MKWMKGMGDIPSWPSADERGNRDARAFVRVSIAREIIEQRHAMGLSQAELASRAGIRQETLSRLETGKHSPTVRTVEKIERAMKRAASQSSRGRKRAG